MLNKTKILGVGFTTAKEEKVLEYILDELSKSKKTLQRKDKITIFTPNPEQVAASARNREIRDLLNQAQVSLPDGNGVVIGARLLSKPIYARIAGVDFMEKLVKSVSERPVITGYLGGKEGVAEATANCLKKKWPKLRVGYASHLYNKGKMIQSDIDILFVGLGFPKQERWILEHKDEIPATVIMAVGGAFDFISGRVPRAPEIVRKFGFEWIFRLIIQPWRIFRQLQILHFSGLIFVTWLSDRLKIFQK